MNLLILTCLLCFVVYSVPGARGSEDTLSSDLIGVTRASASGEGLQTSQGEDDELEIDGELSGGAIENVALQEFHIGKDGRKRRKGQGKRKNRTKSRSTTAFNPEHTSITAGFTSSTHSTTEDPCTSTHLGYCIHGYCKHMEGVPGPVCICMKGYDGMRCGIQTLGTGKTSPEGSSITELLQMVLVLVIIAVVLSVISCTAILLMNCAHYRSHKTFLTSYLGTWSEQEKLQKPAGDPVV